MTDKIEKYKAIVQEEMEYRGGATSIDRIMKRHLIINSDRTDFVIISMGFKGKKFIHHVVYHIQIKDGKIWILQNNTDVDLGGHFEDEGVPRQDIVIGYYHEEERASTKYAIA